MRHIPQKVDPRQREYEIKRDLWRQACVEAGIIPPSRVRPPIFRDVEISEALRMLLYGDEDNENG